MLYILPEDYPEFHCLAGECEDTCCAGWQIVVDDRSLKRYHTERGSYRKTLLRSVDWKKKSFRQDGEKRCAFLNDQNLCEMYCHLGPESLCRTCRMYPRHIEEFENVREISLSVSCPEAARMLICRKEPLRFREFSREGEETYEEFDELLYSWLVECRSLMIRILQNRNLPLKLRLGLVSGLANDMQKRFLQGRLFSCQELFERVESGVFGIADHWEEDENGQTAGKKNHRGEETGQVADTDKKSEILTVTERKMAAAKHSCFPWIRELFGELQCFEFLKEDWPLWLEEVQNRLYLPGAENYARNEREFLEWLKQDSQDWQIPFEQLMVYFLFSYFCGAVYDGEILASAQLGLVHCWLLRDMLMAVWLRNGKKLELEDLRALVVRYSRELEHSDMNQRQMEKLRIRKRLPWLREDC